MKPTALNGGHTKLPVVGYKGASRTLIIQFKVRQNVGVQRKKNTKKNAPWQAPGASENMNSLVLFCCFFRSNNGNNFFLNPFEAFFAIRVAPDFPFAGTFITSAHCIQILFCSNIKKCAQK